MYSSPPVSNVPLYGPLQPKSQSISPKLQGAYGTAGANRAFNYMPATSEKYFINSHKRGCVKYRLCIYITSNNVSGCHRALMNHCSYLPLNPYWYSAGPLLFRAESFDHQPPLYQRTVTHGLWWPSHAQHHHFWIAVIHFTCICLFVLISQKTFLHISNKLASNDMWIVCV